MMLNNADFARSVIGRVPPPGTDFSRRPFALPAMTRIARLPYRCSPGLDYTPPRGHWQIPVCAFLFLASSLRVRDAFSIAGSAVFVVACLYFMIPLVRSLLAEDAPDDTAG